MAFAPKLALTVVKSAEGALSVAYVGPSGEAAMVAGRNRPAGTTAAVIRNPLLFKEFRGLQATGFAPVTESKGKSVKKK